MIYQLAGLSEGEIQQLTNAVPLITILIAGADGEMDREELVWAEKVTKYRTFNTPELLNDFYKLVDENYTEKLKEYRAGFPEDVEERTQKIADILSELNPILAKITDPHYCYGIYKSYVTFAKHIAKASGGVLGMFFRISGEEAKLIDLPMIHAIPEPPEEEEL